MLALTLYAIGTIIALIIANRAYSLYKNYQTALKIGLPIQITLESFVDPLWALIGKYFSTDSDLTTIHWTYHDRYGRHAKLGPAFIHVTPFHNSIVLADVAACRDVASQWKTWIKDPAIYSMFEVFGKNVNSVNGSDWQRHRRLTVLIFKENNNKLVWAETIRQMEQMRQSWYKNTISMCRLRHDANKLGLHVIAHAAFGREYEFDDGLDQPTGQHKISQADALQTVMDNAGPALFLVSSLLSNIPLWLLPKATAKLMLAVKEFRQYLIEDVDAERKSPTRSDSRLSDNLMSALLRANEAAENEKVRLSDDELYGNLFIYNVAGHETTASVIGYAVPYLAIHPEIQDWIHEEVQQCDGSYESFNKLIRIRALMYETLRFFSPVPLLPRTSGEHSATLNIQGEAYVIPPQTMMCINLHAPHWNPELWGEDVEQFKPRRWLETITSADGTEQEERWKGPPEGAEVFLWAFGPRACPGKKFSQVEFASFMVCLLRESMIKPALLHDGEDVKVARERLKHTLLDSTHKISMFPKNPEAASILCVPRS